MKLSRCDELSTAILRSVRGLLCVVFPPFLLLSLFGGCPSILEGFCEFLVEVATGLIGRG